MASKPARRVVAVRYHETVAPTKQHEANFRLALQNSPITLFRQDLNLRYTWYFSADPAFAARNFLGMRDLDLLPPEDATTLTFIKKRVLKRGIGERQEVSLTFSETTRYYNLVVEPTRNTSGDLIGLAGSMIDVTPYKQEQEPLRSEEEPALAAARTQEQQPSAANQRVLLDELISTFSHEFNNSLSLIIGFAQDLMEEVNASDRLYRCLEIIEREGEHCAHLVLQLRDFAHFAVTQRAWTDIQDLILKCLAVVEPQLRQRRIITMVDLPSDLPLLYVDVQQLQKTVLALVSNAMEAMPQGGQLSIRARVTRTRFSENNTATRTMTIDVKDTGVGVTTESHEKVFQPFFAAWSKKNMGVGLWICQAIAHAHGGRITVDSNSAQGATFSIVLPLRTKKRR
jgi:signal transduction histidine kinase